MCKFNLKMFDGVHFLITNSIPRRSVVVERSRASIILVMLKVKGLNLDHSKMFLHSHMPEQERFYEVRIFWPHRITQPGLWVRWRSAAIVGWFIHSGDEAFLVETWSSNNSEELLKNVETQMWKVEIANLYDVSPADWIRTQVEKMERHDSKIELTHRWLCGYLLPCVTLTFWRMFY